MIHLYNDDCLQIMDKLIEDGVLVDAIITDPPYGTTACKWDSVIPFDEMWMRLDRLIKPNAPIILFGSEPFSSMLRCSNIKNFKYDWIWEKPNGTNPYLAKIQPMKKHEIVSVFNSKVYYPQMVSGESYKWNSKRTKGQAGNIKQTKETPIDNSGTRYPSSVQKFGQDRGLHPTQKPLKLMEYLIKTYTNEKETVLDFTMGSGTTGVACQNLNRNFIGIELDKKYFDVAKDRIEKSSNNLLKHFQ